MIQTTANRLRFVAQTIVKRVKQITRPANGSRTSNPVMDIARSKHELLIENALLRQQLIVLERRQKRPQLSNWDRIKLICLARLTPNWKDALHIVQPDTLLRWHRDLFRFVWRRKSKPKGRRRRISQETIDLIRQMAAQNLTWGAERIRGELSSYASASANARFRSIWTGMASRIVTYRYSTLPLISSGSSTSQMSISVRMISPTERADL